MLTRIRQSLQTKLVLAFIAVLLIPSFITAFYNLTRTSEVLVESARLNQLQLATVRALNVENLLTSANEDVLFLNQTPQIRRYTNNTSSLALLDMSRLLQVFLDRSIDRYASICILNASGLEVLCLRNQDGAVIELPASALVNQVGQTYFNQAITMTSIAGRQAPVYISDIELEATNGEIATPYNPIIRYSTLLQGDNGTIAGVLVLTALADPIIESLESEDPQQTTILLDKDGYYLLAPDPDQRFGRVLGTDNSLTAQKPDDADMILSQRQGALFGSSDSPDTFQVFQRIRPTGQSTIQWTVIYQQPLSSLLAPVADNQRVTALITLVALAVAVGAALVVTSGIVRPLKSLANAAQSISQGKARIALPPVTTRDEVGAMVEAFTTMVDRVEARTNELQQSNAVIEATLGEMEVKNSELKIANAQVRENARLKSEFMSTMSHELRTPLNAMLGFTGIMLEGMGGEIDQDARHMVQRIQSNSQRLLLLINDILDIAKIEAGRMELVHAPFSPHDAAQMWQSQLEVLAQTKHLRFTVDVDPNMPEVVVSDRDRLTQVVANLVSNAVKFTESGEVAVKVAAQPEGWMIQVSDTGIGIPPHALNYIFDEFRQVDGTSRRTYGGSGLGLAIVRNICQMMRGRVTVTSELGKGSIFTVMLPLETPALLAQAV